MNSQQIWQDFLHSIKTCLSKYSDFHGRASRQEFWYFFLFSMMISSLFNSTPSAFGSLISLILLVPSLAVATRRLHDLNKSGYLLLILIFPLFGWLFLLYTWAQQGVNGANRFGEDPHEYSFSADEDTMYESPDEPIDLNYQDLPRATDSDEHDEPQPNSKPQKDRYGRDITPVDKVVKRKGSDFLEG